MSDQLSGYTKNLYGVSTLQPPCKALSDYFVQSVCLLRVMANSVLKGAALSPNPKIKDPIGRSSRSGLNLFRVFYWFSLLFGSFFSFSFFFSLSQVFWKKCCSLFLPILLLSFFSSFLEKILLCFFLF